MNDKELYTHHAHRMQTGVAVKMGHDPQLPEVQPKHLRVGINSAHASIDGLSALLLEKGLFTEAEYLGAMVKAMAREADRYEEEVREIYGPKMRLGANPDLAILIDGDEEE